VKLKAKPGTRVIVEEGTLFEVTAVEPNAAQTLRVTRGEAFDVGSSGTQIFDLDTECLNPTRRAPANDPMRLTPFVKP
jgi:hypothetical protein